MIDPGGEDYSALADVLRAAASPLRVALLHRLADGAVSVSNLGGDLGISQPLTSHHLSVLRDAGLVHAEREGRTIRYRIADTPLAWSIVAVVRQQLTVAAGAARRPEHEPGEVAVPHGDHVDFVHDGHLHRDHDGHWDECEPTEHVAHEHADHTHGEGCGHVAVPHGDHVDYVHDGHRHASHNGHYDEH